MYAMIFSRTVKGAKLYTLHIRSSYDLSVNHPSDTVQSFGVLRDAKMIAKLLGAKAWNY